MECPCRLDPEDRENNKNGDAAEEKTRTIIKKVDTFKHPRRNPDSKTGRNRETP